MLHLVEQTGFPEERNDTKRYLCLVDWHGIDPIPDEYRYNWTILYFDFDNKKFLTPAKVIQWCELPDASLYANNIKNIERYE